MEPPERRLRIAESEVTEIRIEHSGSSNGIQANFTEVLDITGILDDDSFITFIGILDDYLCVREAHDQPRAHEAEDSAREAAVEPPVRQSRIAESVSSARG